MTDSNPGRKTSISSWSNILPTTTYLQPFRRSQALTKGVEKFIPRGSGSSFNDAAYVTDGLTITTSQLNRISAIDQENNTVICEAGVELGQLHKKLEKTDLAFPIYGGSQWVTVGGAIASDIHGKNTHIQGAFGNHVEALYLVLADGQEIECSEDTYPELFAATIGGMGLTGLIRAAKLKLQQRTSSAVEFQHEIIPTIQEAVDCFHNHESDFSYYGHWFTQDTISSGQFETANYTCAKARPPLPAINLPVPKMTIQNRYLFQVVHVFQKKSAAKKGVAHIRKFNFRGPHQLFKPVNKVLGPFIEYQFVVPENSLLSIHKEFSKRLRHLNRYMYILKRFGNVPSRGLLSFVKPGFTIGIWFPESAAMRQHFAEFADCLLEVGGRVYLAKDSCISPAQLEQMYPNLNKWRQIVKEYDPDNRIQSDLSRRLNLKPWQ